MQYILRNKNTFAIKAVILKAIRDFFDQEGFLEVDTPCLVTSPDPSPFNEVFKIEGKDLYLTPSPEFFIKKVLSFGIKNVYQITKAYRDWQENDPTHLNEFTILEWYRDNADYTNLMVDCENLISHITKNLKLGTLIYQGQEINLNQPWQRITCKEAFKKYANVNLDDFMNILVARQICQKKGYQVTGQNTWEELYHQIFLNEVEPKLPKHQPLILYDYPAPLAALSQIKTTDPNYAERMEFYIGGLELGNGYSELTDPVEQEKRLIADMEERKRKKMKVFDYDRQLVAALKKGLAKTAGIALGIDRLVMLFTDSTDIHEVTPFSI